MAYSYEVDEAAVGRAATELQNRGSGSGKERLRWWSPENGVNQIRVLPPWPGSKAFHLEYWLHWFEVKSNGPSGTRKHSVPCLRRSSPKGDQPCYLCEVTDQFYKAGDKINGGNLKASSSVFFNIINTRKPQDGVVVMRVGPKVASPLLGLYMNPQTGGNYIDPQNGRDIVIQRTETVVGNGKQVNYSVVPVLTASPLADPAVLDQLHDLASLVKSVTYAEMEEMYKTKIVPADNAATPAAVQAPAGVPAPVALPQTPAPVAAPQVGAPLTSSGSTGYLCLGHYRGAADPICKHCVKAVECGAQKAAPASAAAPRCFAKAYEAASDACRRCEVAPNCRLASSGAAAKT